MMRTLPLLAFLLLHPTAAGAHATPVLYEPAASTTVQRAPTEIVIRFSERVEPSASSIRLFAPDGAPVSGIKAAVNESDAHAFRLPVTATGTGTYTVSWQVVSADDGHYTSGGYAFSVGKPSGGQTTIPSFNIVHRSGFTETLTIAFELFGNALLLGALALWFAGRKHPALQEVMTGTTWKRRLRFLSSLSAVCIAVGTLGYLWIRSADLMIAGAGRASALAGFSMTVTGSYTLYRFALGLLVALLFTLWANRLTVNRARALAVLLFVLALLRARVSHAAASETLPLTAVLVNTVHLLGKNLWIGGSCAFVLLLAPLAEQKHSARVTALGMLTLSRLTAWGLLIGGVTGTFIVWLHLKSPLNLASTLWGMRFLTLLGLAMILVLIRLWILRTAEAATVCLAEHDDARDKQAMKDSGIPLLMEAVCAIVVLFLSSQLIITTPPLDLHNAYRATDGAVTLKRHPAETDALLLTFPADAKTPVVTLTNETEGIGPIVADTQKRFDGGYALSTTLLSPPGRWKIAAQAARESGYDAAGTFELVTPDDLTENHARTVDGFLLLCVAMAMLLAGAAAWLLRLNRARTARVLAGHDEQAPAFLPRPLWLFLPLGLTLFSSIAGYLGHTHGGFSALCEKNGHLWHESVPMRAGKATSTTAALGCMTGTGQGQFHFTDAREYRAFLKPSTAVITMDTPDTIAPGQETELTFHLTENGKPVEDLLFAHDRILHVVIAGADLKTFAHVHPENPVAPYDVLTVRHAFPKPGRYLVAADYTVRAQEFSREFYVTVGSGSMTQDAPDPTMKKTFDGYDVRLTGADNLRAKKAGLLTYEITKDGVPVTDLQPYLAAAMHIAVVRSDLRRFNHVHGMLPPPFPQNFLPRTGVSHTHAGLPDAFGPIIEAPVTFTDPGRYAVFGELRHDGNVIVTRFEVNVTE